MKLFLREILGVAIGGASGCSLRFVLSRYIQAVAPADFPWGILLCNLLGCFLIGILVEFLFNHLELGPLSRSFLIIGFLGGLTTFSSFTLDTMMLLQSGKFLYAMSNILITMVGCIFATAIGMYISVTFFL